MMVALRQLRESKKLTQEQLAEAVGLSTSQISRFEAGERDPRLSELWKLARYFGVPITAVIDGADAAPTPGAPADPDSAVYLQLVLILLRRIGLPAHEAARLLEECRAAARMQPDSTLSLPPVDQMRLRVEPLLMLAERKLKK